MGHPVVVTGSACYVSDRMSVKMSKVPRGSDDEDENRDWKGSWILPRSHVGSSPSDDDSDNKGDLKDIKMAAPENVTGIVACSGIDGYYMDVEDNYEMESMVRVWLKLMVI